MRPGGSDKFLLVAFVALVAGSMALKATAGPPRDGWADVEAGQIATSLQQRLNAQGFATSIVPLKIQSPIVLARRGGCRLSVRDARGGKAMVAQFARDAGPIGPVRYLYRGQSFDVPPGFLIRIGRLQTESQSRLMGRADAYIPIALASSAECGRGTFGVGDFRVEV